MDTSGPAIPRILYNDEGENRVNLQPNRRNNAIQHAINMIPLDALVASYYDTARRLVRPFVQYLDGTCDGSRQGVRFDQWLTHQLLGTSYPNTPHPEREPIDHAAFDPACEIAGIDQAQTLAGDESARRWILLYLANIGNTDVDSSGSNLPTFRQWCQTQYNVDIDTLPDDESAWNWIYEKLHIYGTTIAYLRPGNDPIRYP